MAVYESKYDVGHIFYIVHTNSVCDNVAMVVRAAEIIGVYMDNGEFEYNISWVSAATLGGDALGNYSESVIEKKMAKNIMFDSLDLLNAFLDKMNKKIKAKMKTMKSLVDKRKLRNKLEGDKNNGEKTQADVDPNEELQEILEGLSTNKTGRWNQKPSDLWTSGSKPSKWYQRDDDSACEYLESGSGVATVSANTKPNSRMRKILEGVY